MSEVIERILFDGTVLERLELFCFDETHTPKEILAKFKVYSRYHYPDYYDSKPSPMHDELLTHYVNCYLGSEKFLIKGFRGCAKTAMMKLMVAFFINCDRRAKPRRFIKVLCRDLKNSKQITTDVYNMLLETIPTFGNMFEKEGDKKREETMSSFTTKHGTKMTAGTVGQSQRGSLQGNQRPDFIWFDDIEDAGSIASQAITVGVINKVEEAINGKSPDGSYVCTANYISEYGSVAHLASKPEVTEMVFPILDSNDRPTWPDRFPKPVCDEIKKNAKDWYGDYMCDPTKGANKFFDWAKVDEAMRHAAPPIEEAAGVRYWVKYKPNHRYGQGSDHSMGIGEDANTLAGFDFNEGILAYTYFNNEISPDLAAHEFCRVGRQYGNCVYAWETNNNCGGIVTATVRDIIEYQNMYRKRDHDHLGNVISEKLGWDTNNKTKVTMFQQFRTDWNDGLIKIYDMDVLKEMKAYSNSDLTDKGGVLATRHFDLLMAVVIAWQMNKYADSEDDDTDYVPDSPTYTDIGV